MFLDLEVIIMHENATLMKISSFPNYIFYIISDQFDLPSS
jgi:hypothetical protein